MMKIPQSQLIISNNYYEVKKQFLLSTKDLTAPELNAVKYNEKLDDVNELYSYIMSAPFMDDYRVILFQVKDYTLNELKKIVESISKAKTTCVIAVYYTKNKLDKGDKNIIDLFKKSKISINKSLAVDMTAVKQKIKENNILDINSDIFLYSDNTDIALSDIDKISMIEKDYKNYISKSLTSNVFDLIDYVVKGDATNALTLAKDLLETNKPFNINLALLKHFNLLRNINSLSALSASEVKEVLYKREKLATGKGNYIHPYRLKILIEQSKKCKINLDYAVNELLKNDIKKDIDIVLSLMKILAVKTA